MLGGVAYKVTAAQCAKQAPSSSRSVSKRTADVQSAKKHIIVHLLRHMQCHGMASVEMPACLCCGGVHAAGARSRGCCRDHLSTDGGGGGGAFSAPSPSANNLASEHVIALETANGSKLLVVEGAWERKCKGVCDEWAEQWF
jgi:hypothetical protein